ncbi:MAG: glycosyltransferase [Polyangiales bacterium]
MFALSLFLGSAYAILVVAAVGLVLAGLSVWATWKHLRSTPARAAHVVPVSLLKPLKGLEDDLEKNLRSFFDQEYSEAFEIVFCASDEHDPALELARRLAREYPAVPTRFVLTDEHFGLNPKVANLAGALAAVRYDLVHQSDANTRVPPDYLQKIVAELLASDASMLSSVVVGVGEERLGAALENLQLSAFIGPATCTALRVADITCVCGKSMLFYKSELEEEFGGLASVKDVLCEDFVLGERYKNAGKRVLLSPTPVANINRDCGMERFLERHGRWLKMRATLHLPGFVADLATNPIALALLAVLVSGFDSGVSVLALAVVPLKMLSDQLLLRLTRRPMAGRYLFLTPLKDLLLLPLWLTAVFSRTVVWRGRRLRFGKNTQLIPLGEPALAPAAEAYEEPIAAE